MLSAYLVRGLKAGLVAGVVFGLFVALVATPVIGFAEGLDAGAGHDAGSHGDDHSHAESAVSGALAEATSVLGGVVFGLLLGLVFGAAFYFLEPAIPGEGDTRSYLLAAAGFVTVSGAPWLVVPPQLPGVEATLATDLRIGIYVGMMVAGALACLATGAVFDRLRQRGCEMNVARAGAAVPLVALALIGGVVLPVEPTTGSAPAALAAGYRGLVVVGQLGLWGALAASHAWLLRRAGDSATTTATTINEELAPAGD
jgi:predicted cobalt transporter CbtA